MGNFDKGKKFNGRGGNNNGRSFGGNRGGGKSFGGGRDQGRSEMHKAVCSDCGKSCEVPFRPTGNKPVFCSDCFQDKRGDSPRDNNRGGDRNSKPRYDNKSSYQGGGKNTPDYKAQFEALNTKLDKILKALDMDVADVVVEYPKSTKYVKPAPKVVDTIDLKETISKTQIKKTPTKKPAVKKTPTKKPTTKKAPAKKVVKKAIKKKVTKKPTTKKKK